MSRTVSETISLTQKVQLVFLKSDNELSWTFLLQQRGPHKKPWQAVVWAALV
jgi:hypothetical protein